MLSTSQTKLDEIELLTGILDLPNGAPGKDVFRRVLMALRPEAFEAAFNGWIARLRDEAIAETGVDRPIVAIDGKAARRSHDAKEDLGPLHVVTAWAGEYGLALGQEVFAEKSNEITAIPELLRKIDVRGGVVTIDAMGTQKAIAEEVIRGQADYVLALKGNHESLHRAVIEHIGERLEGDLEGLSSISPRLSSGLCTPETVSALRTSSTSPSGSSTTRLPSPCGRLSRLRTTTETP